MDNKTRVEIIFHCVSIQLKLFALDLRYWRWYEKWKPVRCVVSLKGIIVAVKYCVDKTPAKRCSWNSFVDIDSRTLKVAGVKEDNVEMQIGLFWLQFSKNVEKIYLLEAPDFFYRMYEIKVHFCNEYFY